MGPVIPLEGREPQGGARRELGITADLGGAEPLVRVLGPHGEPVQGALVFAGWPWQTGSTAPARTAPLAETNALGDASFALQDCPRIDGVLQLVALHPDWGAAWGAFRRLGSESRLVMGEPLRAHVEVRSRADVPVSGPIALGLIRTQVSLLTASENGTGEPWIRRHVEQIAGTAQLSVRGLPAGGMPLLVGARGYASTLAWIRPSAGTFSGGDPGSSGGGRSLQVVRLDRERRVEFRVTSGEELCAGVSVEIHGPYEGHRVRWCYAAGVTDASGRVSLAAPEPAPGPAVGMMPVPVITVKGAEYKVVTASVTEEELRRGWKAVDMGMRSTANATLRAEVIDSEGRLARVGVSAIRLDKFGFGARTSHSFLGHQNVDETGTVEFTGVPTGVPIGLRIEPRAGVNSGVIATHTEPMLSAGEVRSVVVRAGELVLVRGTLLLEGEPSPGSLYGTTESRLGGKYGQFFVSVGQSGTFEVSLPPAIYQLGANFGEGATKPEAQVLDLTSLDVPREFSVVFSAQRRAPFCGRLVDGAGKGIAHRSVQMSGIRAASACTTDASGGFELDYVNPSFAGLWVASRDGRRWYMGKVSPSAKEPTELGDIIFDECPVLVTVVDAAGAPLGVGGQTVAVGRPWKLAGQRVKQVPLRTDSLGRVRLWMPSGEHTLGSPAQGKTTRIPDGAGSLDAPYRIDVRDRSKVRYEWCRPLEAQGKGAVFITRIGDSEPFSLRLGMVPGTNKTLYLARGRYELTFEGTSGTRTLETIDLTDRPSGR